MTTKNVLITGGTRGIGLAIANNFLASGHQVYITGTSEKSFENLNADQFKTLVVDFSNSDSLDNFLKEISKLEIDILVNNAGINKIDYTHEVANEDFERIQMVNVHAPFKTAATVAKSMMNKGWGRIVNITSIFGHITKEKRVSYTTSKYALAGMTKTMSVDFAEKNILVNSVAPGFIDTELTRTVLNAEQIKELSSQVPMKRLGQPEEIAEVVSFLCSEKNTFVTGQNIIADGGFTNV